MALQHLGFVDIPAHAGRRRIRPRQLAVHGPTGRVYVAHTANDAVDVIDRDLAVGCGMIGGLEAVAGRWWSDPGLVFTSNRGEDFHRGSSRSTSATASRRSRWTCSRTAWPTTRVAVAPARGPRR